MVARAQPTVPLSWLRLNIMTQNNVLVQYNNYFALEKVQWRLLVINRLLTF